MIQSLDVHLGRFHDVIGVAVGHNSVSILDLNQVERLIPIKPHFDPRPLPITVTGEFGEFEQAEQGMILEGLEPVGITAIEIVPDFEDEDFHTRVLRLKSASGLNLTWELFCENQPCTSS